MIRKKEAGAGLFAVRFSCSPGLPKGQPMSTGSLRRITFVISPDHTSPCSMECLIGRKGAKNTIEKQTIYVFFFTITAIFSFPVRSELLYEMFILHFYQCLVFIQDRKTSGIHPCNFKFDRKNVSCSNTTNVPQKFLWYIPLQKYPTQYTVTQKYRTC